MLVADSANCILTPGCQLHCSSRPTLTSATYFFSSADKLQQTRVNVQLNNQTPSGELLDEKEACCPHLLGSLLIWNCRNLENHPDPPCPVCVDTYIWVRRSALKEQSVIHWMTRLITSKPTGLCLICLLLTNDSLLLIWPHYVAHPSMHLFTQQIPVSGSHEVRIEACRASLAYPLTKSVKWHPLSLLKIGSGLI